MPNASDDQGYDPIDGKPSVMDSPPPYPIIPEQFKDSPKFLSSFGKLAYPESVNDTDLHTCGRALYQFTLGLQQNPDEESVTKATDVLYNVLDGVRASLFTDAQNDKPKIYKAIIPVSPFVIVFGQAVIKFGDNAEAVTVDWIVQNVQNPSGGYAPMGALVQIGVSQAMEDLHPGLMERASKQEITIDELLNLIEAAVVVTS